MNTQKPIIGCTGYPFQMGTPVKTVVGVSEAYMEAIIAGGGIPLLIPVGLNEADWEIIFNRLDGIVLPGGGDIDPIRYGNQERHELVRSINPERDDLEIWLAQTAVVRKKPLLAICRGYQVLNVAMGGTLWQDIASEMSPQIGHDTNGKPERNAITHTVEVDPTSRLAQYIGNGTPRPVNSIHHQGIRNLAPDLTKTAVAPDGLIEGIEIADHPFAVGVQWHPECLIDDLSEQLALFKGFVNASKRDRR